MTKSKQLYNKAKEAGKVNENKPWLNLAEQVEDDKGNFRGTQPTGKHVVEFVDDKVVEEQARRSDEMIKKLEYTFRVVRKPEGVDNYEEGDEVIYRKPVYDDDGNLHYFASNMAQFDYGDTLAMEYVKKGPKKGFIGVQDAMPVVEEDESVAQREDEDAYIDKMEEERVKEEKSAGTQEDESGEDISTDDIPF